MNAMHDVIVIGGGVIGLAIARELRSDRSRSVLVVDRSGIGEGTSWAAAGMLSALSEADSGSSFLDLCMAGQRMYRGFAEELVRETDIDCGCSTNGLLHLASPDDSPETLRDRYETQRRFSPNVEFLYPDELRLVEPRVTALVHGALFFPDDLQVTPRRLVRALHESCIRRGVEIRSGALVTEVSKGVVRIAAEELRAKTIIVASGVWTSELKGLDPPVPVRPRKGQILSLSTSGQPFRCMIRWNNAYFVPRPDGDLVVGATSEDAGFDRSLTPAGIGTLLSKAQAISSHVGSFPIKEMWSGLRPGTPDGLPIIGRSRIPGVFYATGHYRNGILLAPITASIMAALVNERTPELPIEPYSPLRF